MKLYQVWSEGYAATGERSGARLEGEAVAENFDDACIAVCCDRLDKEPDGSYRRGTYRQTGPLGYIPPGIERLKAIERKGNYSIWGCQLFDNEQDARKSFG